MSAELDAIYRSQRLRLAATVTAGAARIWSQSFRERERTIERVVPLVFAGQRRTVDLVDSYMAMKMRMAIGRGEPKGLNPDSYTVDQLRGRPAGEVYDRPFGALGSFLGREEGFGAAMSASVASLERLVRTDLQLTQTHAARDWMADDERVNYYERVLGAGKNCELCVAASERRYYREDLAPIHEHCGCSVAPGFDEQEVGNLTRAMRLRNAGPTYTVQVTPDPELGARLTADGWSG